MPTADVVRRGATVPMRGHRLIYARYDEVDDILVTFRSEIAVSELLVWTETADRISIDVGGGFLPVGSSRDTAADLGAFAAGQEKDATVRVVVPAASGSRHEELPLKIGLGL